MGGSAQQQALGVGDQGAEVGHGAHAHEDQAGIDAQLDAQIQHIHQAHGDGLSHGHGVQHGVCNARRLHFGDELCRDGLAAEQLPVDVAPGKEDLVEHPRPGQIGHQHADGDGHQ